jgi:hypothetical protein
MSAFLAELRRIGASLSFMRLALWAPNHR